MIPYKLITENMEFRKDWKHYELLYFRHCKRVDKLTALGKSAYSPFIWLRGFADYHWPQEQPGLIRNRNGVSYRKYRLVNATVATKQRGHVADIWLPIFFRRPEHPLMARFISCGSSRVYAECCDYGEYHNMFAPPPVLPQIDSLIDEYEENGHTGREYVLQIKRKPWRHRCYSVRVVDAELVAGIPGEA